MPEAIEAASHAADAAHTTGGLDLTNLVVLLAAAVIAVPLFKRLGVGPIIGYLAAGVVIGPSVLGFFADPASVLHIAELGVVLLLFVIGLEMQPSRLWALRRSIFGLGVVQVIVCGAALTGVLILAGLDPVAAFVGGAGFTLTSTALVLQIMEDEGSLRSPGARRSSRSFSSKTSRSSRSLRSSPSSIRRPTAAPSRSGCSSARRRSPSSA